MINQIYKIVTRDYDKNIYYNDKISQCYAQYRRFCLCGYLSILAQFLFSY